jgi:hypothetical protein
MLLHGDGTNGAQNNTFLDSSTNNFTITRNGNTTQGSFSPYGSNWSNFFDGTGDYLSLADNANLNPATQDFVMEAWVYLTGTTGSNQGINGKGTAGTDGYTLFVTDALVLSFVWNGTGGATITGGTLALNTWNHVAAVRNSSVIRLYLNGVGAGSSTACTTDITSTATKFVGQARGGSPILGYISNYRMTKGSLPSGYDATSSTLTVPTAPLTAISGTSLLTCQSNRFIDNSANNFAITVNGNTSVQRFNPFGASSPYSTSVIGGSGYFDGSGDSLATASSADFGFGTGDFTIECWAYPLSSAAQRLVFFSNDINNLDLGFSSLDTFQYYNGSVNNTGVSASSRQWFHFAVSRTSGTTSVYINGVRTNNITDSTDTTTRSVQIGNSPSSNPFNGYINDVRIIKGTGIYSGTTITVPTAPLTAVTNTKLLLNYTNGAIFDNAMMNDLETVGNAQISTSVVKYGTGSIYFDGTGDGLFTRSTPDLAFGTGDFTVELWLNLAANLNAYANVIQMGRTGNAFTIEAQATVNVLTLTNYTSTVYFSSSTALTTGTWIHIAATRASGTLRLFQNGILVGSAANTVDFTNTGTGVYIGRASDSGEEINGYIDELRITKGYARYTANFTPPTEAFLNIGPN